MLNNLSAREGIENQDSSYWLVFLYGLKYTQDRGRKYRRKKLLITSVKDYRIMTASIAHTEFGFMLSNFFWLPSGLLI